MVFEGVEVGDAVFDELWPNERAGVVPELAVGGEDACNLSSVRSSMILIKKAYSSLGSPSIPS